MKKIKLKFKVGDNLIYDGKEVVVVGIDQDSAGLYEYLVVFLGTEGKLRESDTLKYSDNEVNLDKYGDCDYDWASASDLKTKEQEKAEILEGVNQVYMRRFKSGAVRSDDRGRENPAFISPYALRFLAEHFSANAALFNGSDSAKNYMKGIEPVDIEGSLARHYVEFGLAMMPNRRHNVQPIKQALVEIMANCVMGLHQIGMAEDGEYVELFTKTEYIKKEEV